MAPRDLALYLSEYLQVATDVISRNKGIVDKYVGDGIMAIWGAPLEDAEHAENCCATVLELKDVWLRLNLKWRAEGKSTNPKENGQDRALQWLEHLHTRQRQQGSTFTLQCSQGEAAAPVAPGGMGAIQEVNGEEGG
jgi:hypothetical protein